MDGELVRELYHEFFHHRKLQTERRCSYQDAVILWIYFLGVLHDRSTHWAHDRRTSPTCMTTSSSAYHNRGRRRSTASRWRSAPTRTTTTQRTVTSAPTASRAATNCTQLSTNTG
jgi:hypothetical protein